MGSPPLVHYDTMEKYRDHFHQLYCCGPILTFDNLSVRFIRQDFDHCMYESTKRNKIKDQFSLQRAQRIEWIKTALQDSGAQLYQGWDRDSKTYVPNRRVTYAYHDYLVVIRILQRGKARFITAYTADISTIAKVKSGPLWIP